MASKRGKKSRRYFEVMPIIKKYPSARYYYLLGGRGTGKTFPTVKKCIIDFLEGRGVSAYVRRYKESLTIRNMSDLLSPHNAWLAEKTGGKWNRITYYQRGAYLERWETTEEGAEERVERCKTPVIGFWAMNTWETDKGGDFGADKGGIANIIVDEVTSKGGDYLKDEWTIFQNVIASLVRDRWEKDTKIFLLSNPVSKWANPYLRNMGIKKEVYSVPGITEIKYPSEIQGKAGMSAVFCYIAAVTDKEGNVIDVDENRTNVYNTFFAFPNSKGKSRSITSGFWEMDESARLPSGVYGDSETVQAVGVIYQEDTLIMEIMRHKDGLYYLHLQPCRKINPKTYYFTLQPVIDRYAIIGLKNAHPITKVVSDIYRSGQVYYSDDATADSWHGFVKESKMIVA